MNVQTSLSQATLHPNPTMNITITINTDNSAFEYDPQSEVGRILRKTAKQIEDNGLLSSDDMPCIDFNGNKVGKITVTE